MLYTCLHVCVCAQGGLVCRRADWNYQLCSFPSPLLFQRSNLSNHQSQHTNIGPWDSPPLGEGAKNFLRLLLAESLKAALQSFQQLERLILRCSARKVQVTMAATAWAALPPGVSLWLHGSDGRLSHSSGSPGNLVWRNVALRQQTVLSKAYQGHMQKNGSLIAKFLLYLSIINKLVSLQL